MQRILHLFRKYREQILYVVFGGLTTLINMAAYWLLCDVLRVPNTPSVAIAWLLSVIFAFVTNKLFVFDSKATDKASLTREALSFFSCRALTGLMDLVIMYVAVDLLHGPNLVWKLISNVLVIIINYVASKLFIFRKP